jgi:hypothetical protein
MTDINLTKWEELQDAYGRASRVRDFLRQVIENKSPAHDTQSGPWFELWSRLYHQGSIFTASYAAVPVLVEAIKGETQPFAMDFFLLPASIELARIKSDAPKMPETLEEDYSVSIKELGVIATNLLIGEPSDPYLKKAAQAAQLVAEGKHNEASDLIDE